MLHYRYTGKTIKKDWKQVATEMGFNPDCCPICKEYTMITLFAFDRRGPPDQIFIDSLRKKLLTKAI